ncbi:hypothetical protein [Chryseobacterium hagamense]|nr:hypothetical protein [Chryseobacterium hagamense]
MKNMKKLSGENLRQIAGGGPGGKLLQSLMEGIVHLPSQASYVL